MKRVYRAVTLGEDPAGYTVLLDGKAIATPACNPFVVASHRLAQAVAGEWANQGAEFDPTTMRLTQLVTTSIDKVLPDRDAAISSLCEYLKTDLVCYRATEPQDLTVLQAARFDPLLEWFERHTGQVLIVTRGVMPVAQPEASLAAMDAYLRTIMPELLVAMQVATGLTASFVIALALAETRITAPEAFEAAFVDELYQVRRWGRDADAVARLNAIDLDLSTVQRYVALVS